MVFMFWSGLRRNVDITGSIFNVDTPLTLDNYRSLFDNFDFSRHLANSLVIAGGATALGIFLGSPIAYAVARGRAAVVGFVALMARMSPALLFVLPFFIFAVKIRAVDNDIANYAILIVAHLIVSLPLSVWLIMPFFAAIPTSIDEAALIDGCTPLQRFARVALPLARHGVIVAFTLSFILTWNFFLFALVLSNGDTAPLPVIAFRFVGDASTDWGGLMAAGSLISMPALVLTIFAQRWLVRGVAAGAVK
jgi:multiple sugar transport system permease protein